jgi:dynein light chain LC8-type
MSDRKLNVHFSDVSQDLLIFAVERAAAAIERKDPDNEIAKHLKIKFDKEFYPSWHCIVGKNFGAYVSNEENKALYFTYGQTSVLLFRAG